MFQPRTRSLGGSTAASASGLSVRADRADVVVPVLAGAVPYLLRELVYYPLASSVAIRGCRLSVGDPVLTAIPECQGQQSRGRLRDLRALIFSRCFCTRSRWPAGRARGPVPRHRQMEARASRARRAGGPLTGLLTCCMRGPAPHVTHMLFAQPTSSCWGTCVFAVGGLMLLRSARVVPPPRW